MSEKIPVLGNKGEQYMNIFEIYQFIAFLSDLLTIDKDIKIEFMEIETPARFVVKNDEYTILLNKDMLNDKLVYCDVLTHEMRHFYQYLVVNDKEYVELEKSSTRKKWLKSFRSYRSFAECDYSEEIHSSQTIELDAICFSQLVINTIYPNVKINEFKMNDFRFQQRLFELSNDFTKEEIEECMRELGIRKQIISNSINLDNASEVNIDTSGLKCDI